MFSSLLLLLQTMGIICSDKTVWNVSTERKREKRKWPAIYGYDLYVHVSETSVFGVYSERVLLISSVKHYNWSMRTSSAPYQQHMLSNFKTFSAVIDLWSCWTLWWIYLWLQVRYDRRWQIMFQEDFVVLSWKLIKLELWFHTTHVIQDLDLNTLVAASRCRLAGLTVP